MSNFLEDLKAIQNIGDNILARR